MESVHGLRCYGNTRNVWQSPAVIRQAHRTHYAWRRRLPSPAINRRAFCVRDVICNEAVPFRPYCRGVVTRTRNVSEYVFVLALCLVNDYHHRLLIQANRPKQIKRRQIEGICKQMQKETEVAEHTHTLIYQA